MRSRRRSERGGAERGWRRLPALVLGAVLALLLLLTFLFTGVDVRRSGPQPDVAPRGLDSAVALPTDAGAGGDAGPRTETVDEPPREVSAPGTPPTTTPLRPPRILGGTLRPEDVAPLGEALVPRVRECLADHRANPPPGRTLALHFDVESRDGRTSLRGLRLEGVEDPGNPWLDACLEDLSEEVPLPALRGNGHARVQQPF